MGGVFKTWMMRAETGKDGTTKVIASTPSVDRYGDVVAPDWKLERYQGLVAWAHDYTLPPIGKVTDLGMDGESLIARIKWDDNAEHNPLGATVAHQFREGFLTSVSVGFAPTKSTPRKELPEDHPAAGKSGHYFTGNELLEISAVPIPANPEAVAIRAKMWGLEPDPVQRHILNVTEDEETVTITIAKEEAPAEEEPAEEPTAEAEEAPEEEAAQGDLWGLPPAKAAPHTPETAEASPGAIAATVRATLLELLGYDSQVQEAVDAALTEDEDGQKARDGWADLFGND